MKSMFHLTVRALFLSVAICFLCSCASNLSRELVPKDLQDLVKANLLLLGDDFEKLPETLRENEIIFLGEVHNVGPLREAADLFSVYLANHRPVVYAHESVYGFSLFLEPASLGNPTPRKRIILPKCIEQFNSSQAVDKKILMTTLDVQHNLGRDKTEAVVCLQELAGRSSSDVAKTGLDEMIAQLANQDSFVDMGRYLKRLKHTFVRHIDTFTAEDQNEIRFFVDLLEASNRFAQYKNPWGTGRGWDIREKYFTKTVERAYRKAQKRNAILLCRVGTTHIRADIKKMQGPHFKRAYRPTKGKVACISMVPLYFDDNEPNDPNKVGKSIDSAVKHLMKEHKYGYLSLDDLQKSTDYSLGFSRHFYGKRPKYDRILFVRIFKK